MKRRIAQLRCVVLVATTVSCLSWMSSPAVAQELLGYWKLDETDISKDALDSSGKGLHGVFEGEVELNVDGPAGFGKAAHFDGSTAQILIGAGDENGLGDLTSNFSVMAWINPDQLTHKNRVFGSAPHGGAGWGWGTNSDQLEITTWGIKDYDQAAAIEVGEWTHAAIVLDENFEAQFYVNGEFVGTQSHPVEGTPTFNSFYIGYACCAAEHFEGSLDEVAVFQGVLTEAQVRNAMNLGVSNFNGPADPLVPLDNGTITDPAERANYVHNTLKTWVGDANLDREFNSTDLVAVFAAGQYEDAVAKNSGWRTGDWNGDREFDTTDFVVAFGDGGYEKGPRAATAAVPEPSGIVLCLAGGLVFFRRRRGLNK